MNDALLATIVPHRRDNRTGSQGKSRCLVHMCPEDMLAHHISTGDSVAVTRSTGEGGSVVDELLSRMEGCSLGDDVVGSPAGHGRAPSAQQLQQGSSDASGDTPMPPLACTAVAVAWPSHKLERGQVEVNGVLGSSLLGASADDEAAGQRVAVRLFPHGAVCAANTMSLYVEERRALAHGPGSGQPQANIPRHFHQYVGQMLRDRLVHVGGAIVLSLYGRPVTVRVSSVDAGAGQDVGSNLRGGNGGVGGGAARGPKRLGLYIVTAATQITIAPTPQRGDRDGDGDDDEGEGDEGDGEDGVCHDVAVAGAPAGEDGEEKEDGAFAGVGGLSAQIAVVREMVELPLSTPEVFESMGVRPPRGLLLYGPPGTGKTLVAKAVSKATFAHFVTINGAEIISAYVGESEANLRNVFDEAVARQPTVIFIDEIDALCPRRDSATEEVHRRIVSTLLTLMDGLGSSDEMRRVVVLAATNRPDALDPALRRPGRFDREVEIGVPSSAGRAQILRVLLRDVPHRLDGDTMDAIAARAHGFVGADLEGLVQESLLHAVRRSWKTTTSGGGTASGGDVVITTGADGGEGGGDGGDGNGGDTGETGICISAADVHSAMRSVKPSALREVAVEVPYVKWTDIGGQFNAKQQVRGVNAKAVVRC